MVGLQVNELKEPIQFIKHADKKEVTECANYKESQENSCSYSGYQPLLNFP